MLSDLFRFYAANKDLDVKQVDAQLSIDEYLNQHGYSTAFRQEHLYPMCGALWSCRWSKLDKFPINLW